LKKKALVVGHSHLGALEFFSRSKDCSLEFDLDFVQLLAKEFDPGSNARAADELAFVLRKKAASADLCVLSISGNEHQMMGLVNHPRPFDFVLPERPEIPLLAGREVVPFEIIEDALRSWMREDLFEELSRIITIPAVQLESPPPILDHDHITRYSGIFKDKIETLGINHPMVRYKLWRTSCRITKSFCEKFSIRYVEAPPEAIGPEGFLHYKALSPDPTHANAWYGGLVVNQIRQLLNQDK